MERWSVSPHLGFIVVLPGVLGRQKVTGRTIEDYERNGTQGGVFVSGSGVTCLRDVFGVRSGLGPWSGGVGRRWVRSRLVCLLKS